MFTFYILKSKYLGTYYVGCTKDIEERLTQHNAGFSLSTSSGRPWVLIYQEKFYLLSQARKRELQIKKWKSRAAIERLIKNT